MIVGRRDTIAAVATPAGVGGIGIVRISGARARDICAQVVNCRGDFPDRQLVSGVAADGSGRIDEVLAVVMRGPRSYTGEDVAEIHGHGGPANMARLLRAVIEAGARHAEAGEFTRRAFENGRLDLLRAEAVIDVINAGSERAWRVAQSQLGGRLGERIAGLRERATELLAEVEASIDFPDEDLQLLESSECGARAVALGEEIKAVGETYRVGRVVRDGVDVAIVGAVNSGKSSLFNALLGQERAIVTAEPGTTRDFVEATVVWQGLQITLIDTAGEREDIGSEAERRGVELARERRQRAELVVLTHEAPLGDDIEQREGQLDVLTKADLSTGPCQLLSTSALSGAGIAQLRDAIVGAISANAGDSGEGEMVTSERHWTLLMRSAAALCRGGELIGRAPAEVVAVELREGVLALAEIFGEEVGEDVLDAVFSRFCIGK